MTLIIFIGFIFSAIGGITWAWSGDLVIDVAMGTRPDTRGTDRLIVFTTVMGVSMLLLGAMIMYTFLK